MCPRSRANEQWRARATDVRASGREVRERASRPRRSERDVARVHEREIERRAPASERWRERRTSECATRDVRASERRTRERASDRGIQEREAHSRPRMHMTERLGERGTLDRVVRMQRFRKHGTYNFGTAPINLSQRSNQVGMGKLAAHFIIVYVRVWAPLGTNWHTT